MSKQLIENEVHTTGAKRSGSGERQQKVGVLTMSGPYIARHKDEILDLMRDMTKGLEQKHPQAPSIRITEKPAFSIEVTFTDGELARDLGRDLHKKYRGELDARFEDDGLSVRVTWWC